MSRIACLLGLVVVAVLVSGAACNGKGKSPGDGGGGASGSSGGAAGTGGGAAGTGGGAPITSCPAEAVSETPCTGTFRCEYDFARTCHGRCYSHYVCINGTLMYTGANDGCLQMPCPDGGAGSGGPSVAGNGGTGGRGGAGGTGADASTAAVCTFGADQTCNDDPRVSSIHGRCTEAGACVCGDAGTNPDSGRCL